MSKNPYVAVVGCGYWGKNHVRNFYELGALSCLCDSDQDALTKLSEQYDLPSKDFDAILKDKLILAVVIATPAITHAKLVEAALLAGKHVFVEKPLALKVTDAEKLTRLANKNEKILMVGHLLQYHPAFIRLKQMVSQGDLGKLQYLYSTRLNLGKLRREENILWSFAPHDISMVLSLVGELPSEVNAFGASYLNKELYDITTTHLKFSNNISAHIFVSWLYPYKEQKLIVVAEKGMAVFNDGLPWEEKLQVYYGHIDWVDGCPNVNKKQPDLISIAQDEPLKQECRHFLECIRLNTQPITDGAEGMRVLQVISAAEQSIAKENQCVLKSLM